MVITRLFAFCQLPIRHISSWSIMSSLFLLALIGPFIALIFVALGDSEGLWLHLMNTVFPRYVLNTTILMLGVSLLTLFFGIVTAWITARFNFPGSKILNWALLLPATVPSYIIAYTYTDLLEFAGPIQIFMREAFGWRSARDYWFPEIRSMGGAILVMSSVLYPYIYLMARTAFRLTPASFFEVALLKKPTSPLLLDLSLARPAIVAGLALVLMEVLSDFGTVEFFAIETLTLGIFNIWLGMNNLTAAAQIAGIAFIFILALLFIEITARKRQKFDSTNPRSSAVKSKNLTGGRSVLCLTICLIPLLLGFITPVAVLSNFVFQGFAITNLDLLISASINSISIALSASFIVVIIATVLVLFTTYHYEKHPIIKLLSTVSAMGYAFPGAILAIGVVGFAGAIDSALKTIQEEIIFFTFDGFLIGSVGLLIFACVLRFQAIGHGAITSGINRLSPNIMNASYILGRSFSNSMTLLAPPLLKKSMLAGGLLVFVDVMKELPMTLLLRPFNFETLSTYVYQFAKDEMLEQSAFAALSIIFVGLGPVIIMSNSQKH